MRALLGIVCAVMVMTVAASAGDKEDVLIDKIVSAYGADILSSAKTMTVEDHYKRIFFQQGLTPDEVGVGTYNTGLIVDFKNKRKSTEIWFKGRGNTFYDRNIYDGETGFSLDNLQKTYSENTSLTYATMGQGNLRWTDFGLVKLLLDARSSAKYGGEALYNFKPHEVLSFKAERFPEITLFLDKSTHTISKMTFGSGDVVLKFSEHQENGQITYANATDIFVRGKPVLILVNRTIQIDRDVSGAFDIPADYQDNGGIIDTSEMLTQRLADHVYFASQSGSSSLFVDVGDSYIGVGSRQAITERFQAVQNFTGDEKPLGSVVITHFHSDHIAAADEIASLGANFITVDGDVPPLKILISGDISDDRFKRVDGALSLAGGRVEVYDIRTPHADHNLLFYVPEEKILFSADHFDSNYKTGLPHATEAMVVFRHAIEALGLDVEQIVSSHGSRIHTMDDLHTVTKDFKGWRCAPEYTLCSGQK